MRFLFEVDTGDIVNFWIAPDNPLAVPRVAIVVDGERRAEMAANLVDDGIKRGGRHATGECRFVITERDLPGLASLPRVDFYDLDTNTLVYRRVPPDGLVPRRMIVVDTGFAMDGALQGVLFRHFQYCCFGLHLLSDEIISSVFAHRCDSMLVTGKLLVPRYNVNFTSEHMLSTILLHDPFVQMATRMLHLQMQAPLADDPRRSWRLGPLRDAARLAGEYDFASPKSLKRFFWMLPEPAYHLLFNPLTRQLGTTLPDDRVSPGTSIVAMEQLARFEILGHRDAYEAFALSIFDALGLDEVVPEPEPIPAAVTALAERLRKVKEVEEMLVYDIALAGAVLSSVRKSWKS